MHKGSCLCGSVHYAIAEELSDFGYCHCQSCQKASGSAFGANVGAHRNTIEIHDHLHQLKEYESSPGKFRVFCGHCGTPVYAYHSATAHLLRIRLGTLDTPLHKSCQAHTFVSEKASWEKIEGEIPQFDTWADPEVLVQVGSKQPI